MTKLTKKLKRECVRQKHGGRELVITLLPGDVIEVREKGRVKGYTMSALGVYFAGARAEADRNLREKRKQRKLKRAGLA